MARRRDGQVVKRGEGRWQIKWFDGRDASGKRRYRSKAVRGTRRDAERELRKTLASKDAGTYVEPSRETLSAYLTEWLQAVKPRLASRTYRDYKRALTAYVIPLLGEARLADLRAVHIQKLYGDLQETGLSKREGAQGLGPRAIRLIHAPLRKALAQALKWDKIARNPALGVELPAQRRTEKRALEPDQVRALLKAAEGSRFEALWIFMLDTGARPGEALGLRWSDLDLDAKTVTIRGAAAQDESGRPVLSEHPKTARSRRTLALHANTVEALRAHRKRQAEHALKAGPNFNRDLGLVFPSEVGTVMSEGNLRRRYFADLLEAAKLAANLTPYSLRHTCATLALKAGIPVLVVAERLGHSNANMILAVYGHVLEGQQAEATERLGAVLFGGEEGWARAPTTRPGTRGPWACSRDLGSQAPGSLPLPSTSRSSASRLPSSSGPEARTPLRTCRTRLADLGPTSALPSFSSCSSETSRRRWHPFGTPPSRDRETERS